MIKIKKQNFVKGAIILVAANTISKVLGAVFKIPITYILKEEGMAIFNSAMQIYVTVLTVITAGIPIAISKLVAEQTVSGSEKDIHKTVHICEILLVILGIIGSAVLFFGADFFAAVIKDSQTAPAIKAISPAVFFVAVGVVYKSYYQGTQNMSPTAISQVIEAVIKLTVGYGLAVWLVGKSIREISAGAIFGTTIGEIVATFILLILYIPDKLESNRKFIDTEDGIKYTDIIKNIAKIALPLTLATAIGSILSAADISLIRIRLQDINFTQESAQYMIDCYSRYTDVFDNLKNNLNMGAEGARWLYGAYSGYALTVFHLPPGIVGTLGVSILPVIASSYSLGDIKKAARSTELAIRIVILISLPCAVGMMMFAQPVLELLFKNTASAQMLKIISPGIVTVCLTTITTAVLHASGHIITPFKNMIIGTICKLAAIYFLAVIPQINILAAPISTNIDYFVTVILDLYAVKKILNIKPDIKGMIIKPVFSTAVMAVMVWLLYAPMCAAVGNSGIGLALTVCIGGLVYAISLIMVGAVTKNEIMGILKRL